VKFVRITLLSLFLALIQAQLSSSQDLARLKYNNPGLVVDLGVGLWAWPVPCDADGDGDFDLVVSCPDKPSNGIWLFENASGDTGTTKFPVFKAPRRLSHAVHYVMPSYVGDRLRVLTPGHEHPDFAVSGLAKSIKLKAPATIHTPQGQAPGGRANKIRHNQWRYVDYDGDGPLDLIVGIEDWSDYGWDDAWDSNGRWKNGRLHGLVYWLRNSATSDQPHYETPRRVEAGGQDVDTFGCPTPNFADFDADGDLDLLCGEFLDGFTYFENRGTRTSPRYAAGRRLQTPAGEMLVMGLQMIVPIAFDWDRDGDLDLVVGDEDGRVALVENTGLGDDRAPRFLPPRYFQQQADDVKCGALATPVGFDWDSDGDTDIIAGNTAGYIEYFENTSGPGVAFPSWAAPKRLEAGGEVFRVMAGENGSVQGPAEAKWGYTTLSVADWDGDGLHDIVFNSIWGRVEWLRNVGTRGQPRLAASQKIDVQWPHSPPKPAWTWWTPLGTELVTQWRTTPLVFDFTGDSLVDLAVLDTEGYLVLFERAKRNGEPVLLAPRRAFVDEDGQPLRLNDRAAGASGRRKLCVADWNGDGRFDLLVNSANADLLLQVDAREGKWIFRRAGPIAKQNIEGHDVSPTVVDFDGDGVSDFLGGAEDGRFYFLANPRSKTP
jgi:hypothetical protein